MNSNPLIPQPADADDPAVALIRAKVTRAYQDEPDAVQEMAEVKNERLPSKHQQYMQELSASGKSLAEIQTAWHHYYTTLSDQEKRDVWQEFYDANQHTPYQKLFQKQAPVESRKRAEAEPLPPAQSASARGVVVADHTPMAPVQPARKPVLPNTKLTRQLKHQIGDKISAQGKLKAKHHLQSLGFGLASGFIVLLVFLFTFFNEYIIAPFIQPSRNVSSTPIILGDSTVSAEAPPSVTIPKINIQIPIDFTLNTYDENVIENSLKNGAIHYPNTVLPGQNGNAAYFGHSSGNIFNSGKYFFAFTLLHDLTTGDLFYINYGGKQYAYRIFDRQVVPPTDVGVISDSRGKQATAELITCDPPGISTNRLVLWGEQISPNISTNTNATPAAVSGTPTAIVGNGPTLWSKFVGWVEFWK